jgi:hypothetical protein
MTIADPRQIYDRLCAKGLTPAQACGVLGNMKQESAFQTHVLGFDGTGSVGLCQWLGPRKAGLASFAKRTGRKITDWAAQVDWIFIEFNQGEHRAYHELLLAKTPSEAAVEFSRHFERPAAKYANNQNRMAWAERFMRLYA